MTDSRNVSIANSDSVGWYLNSKDMLQFVNWIEHTQKDWYDKKVTWSKAI